MEPDTATLDEQLAPDTDYDEALAEADAPRSSSSAFDKLRAEHSKAIADTSIDLDVPTFGGKLVARHRALDYPETEAIAKAVATSEHPKKILLGMVDTIIRSLDELLWRDEPDGELVSLASELERTSGQHEEPVKFDERLADALGFKSKTARGVALDAFGKEMAVVSYYADLTRWMERGRRKAADEFEGES